MNRQNNLFLATLIATFFASVANVHADPAGPDMSNLYIFDLSHWIGNCIGLVAIILMIVTIRIFWRGWKNSTGNKRPILATVLFAIGYAAFAHMLVDLFHHWSREI
jgi:hypothetical protein